MVNELHICIPPSQQHGPRINNAISWIGGVQVSREAGFGIFMGICLVLLHLMIPDQWTGYKTWNVTFYDGFSALSACLEHVRPCVLRDAGLGIFMRICHILLHLCVPDWWHGFWAWNWTSFDGFSALSTHLECVRLCRL